MNNTTTAVTINEIKIVDSGIYATATCGKTTATVCIKDYEVRVICQNAAHRAWKGMGRGFSTVAAALAAYKSPEMKAIIEAVDRRDA